MSDFLSWYPLSPIILWGSFEWYVMTLSSKLLMFSSKTFLSWKVSFYPQIFSWFHRKFHGKLSWLLDQNEDIQPVTLAIDAFAFKSSQTRALISSIQIETISLKYSIMTSYFWDSLRLWFSISKSSYWGKN